MKTLTVAQAKPQLGKLVEGVQNGDSVLIVHQNQKAMLTRCEAFNPEEDSPELEALLLEGVRSAHSPYSPDEMKRILRNACRRARKK